MMIELDISDLGRVDSFTVYNKTVLKRNTYFNLNTYPKLTCFFFNISFFLGFNPTPHHTSIIMYIYE